MPLRPATWAAATCWLLVVALGLEAAAQTTTSTAGASGGPSPASGERLRVGTFLSPPFVIDDPKTGLTGISVELWKSVGEQLGVEYELSVVPGVQELIEDVTAGRFDVGVGPISITSLRASRVDFSQPYFEASMGILTRPEQNRFWARARPFLSRAFMVGAGFLVFVLFLVGNVIWLAERKKNPSHFPARYLSGVGNGMWFALVTMTTVGYGDRAPVTPLGRVVSGIWMVIAMITASSLTAGIATALTLSQLGETAIDGMDALRGRRVAVVRGTTGAELAEEHGARAVETADQAAAIQTVLAGEADAVVFDLPGLQAYLHRHPKKNLVLVDSQEAIQNYGFIAGPHGRLGHRIDQALLFLLESGRVARIRSLWLADQAPRR